MNGITTQWFECRVKYLKTTENGTPKVVTELYVVDALSFAEAEARIIEEMTPFISGEFAVQDVKKASFKEIFFMSDGERILAGEEEKLVSAIKKGGNAAMDQYRKPTDFNPNNHEAYWYKAKLQFITLDEKSGLEKRSPYTILLQACSLGSALSNIDNAMRGTMVDYVECSVTETKIIDVFLRKMQVQGTSPLNGD